MAFPRGTTAWSQGVAEPQDPAGKALYTALRRHAEGRELCLRPRVGQGEIRGKAFRVVKTHDERGVPVAFDRLPHPVGNGRDRGGLEMRRKSQEHKSSDTRAYSSFHHSSSATEKGGRLLFRAGNRSGQLPTPGSTRTPAGPAATTRTGPAPRSSPTSRLRHTRSDLQSGAPRRLRPNAARLLGLGLLDALQIHLGLFLVGGVGALALEHLLERVLRRGVVLLVI